MQSASPHCTAPCWDGPCQWAFVTLLRLELHCSPGASLTAGSFSRHSFNLFNQATRPGSFFANCLLHRSPLWNLRHLSKDSLSVPTSRSPGTPCCGSKGPAAWAVVKPLVFCRLTWELISPLLRYFYGTGNSGFPEIQTGQIEGLLYSHHTC